MCLPGRSAPPDPAAPAGEFGFTFDRSGYRVPAILVSPWVESGSVYNEEYRHTSLIATLRKAWGLGDALTQRDASARTFDNLFTRETPRDPDTLGDRRRRNPCPNGRWTTSSSTKPSADSARRSGRASSQHAKAMGVTNLPPQLDDPDAELTPELIIEVIRDVAWHFFPQLAPEGEVH